MKVTKTDHSDVFGPLAPCGNCEKTKKNCTFEWLKSQRVTQSTQSSSNSIPPAKRRRTSSAKSTNDRDALQHLESGGPSRAALFTSCTPGVSIQEELPLDLAITFADFPGGPTAFEQETSMSIFGTESPLSDGNEARGKDKYLKVGFDHDRIPLDCDSGKGSSLETPSEKYEDRNEEGSPLVLPKFEIGETSIKSSSALVCDGRKRRRRGSSSSMSNGAPPCPTVSFASHIVSSTNNAFLRESILKIYHNSFENALSCWVTERTCPYTAKADVSLTNDNGPDWNRIYHRVFRLDRLAANIRGRQLTFTEDSAASKAINSAIYAFATQWAQSSRRSNARYPFNGTDANHSIVPEDAEIYGDERSDSDFDRTLQINAWHEAHEALQKANQIESFRVVLAQIVFALTQKPTDETGKDEKTAQPLPDPEAVSDVRTNTADSDITQCEDLMSKLDLAIDADGPPTHLEQGLRLIHSLRSRMAMNLKNPRLKQGLPRYGKQYRASTGSLDNSDRAAVDLLFWLGVMFDTLSAAMHKRPLVVSDEDSDIYPACPGVTQNGEAAVESQRENAGIWDGYLFAPQNNRLHESLVRWPCSFDQAAALLCDAAPVKVILFRKITRIQTLLARKAHGVQIEKSLSAALEVCEHWSRLYAPFIDDCIRNHDKLHPRIQSWYTCLAGHWHLATLLLADLIEIIDDSETGDDAARKQRASSKFVAYFREYNCRILSEMAGRACPREDSTFSQSRDFHFALNQGALLTEPWTAVLIRAFAKAGAILLESDATLPLQHPNSHEDTFQRADDCVRALWYLGRKSDMALSAAKILGNALKERRKDAQEKVSDMSCFLQNELWTGFEGLDGVFGTDCEL